MPYSIGFPIVELNPGCGAMDATNLKANGFAVHDPRPKITVARKLSLLLECRINKNFTVHSSLRPLNNIRGLMINDIQGSVDFHLR